MPLGSHGPRRTLNRSFSSRQRSAVWISEELLDDTFQQFLHVQRRHGSSVPGPLEARRRWSKRKNTSLSTSGQAAPVDVGTLFGTSKQNPWWEASKAAPDPVAQGAGSLLPWWLRNARPPASKAPKWTIPLLARELSPDHTLSDDVVLGTENETHEEKDPTLDLTSEGDLFKKRLAEAKRFEDVKPLLRALPSLDNYQLVLDHLLRNHSAVPEVRALLLDQSIDCPSANTYLQILTYLSQEYDTKWPRLLKCVEDGLLLGHISQAELRPIFQRISSVLTNTAAGKVPLGQSRLFYRHLQRLLSKILDSRNLQISDLGRDTTHTILTQLGRTPFDPQCATVFRALLDNIPGIGRSILYKLVTRWAVSITSAAEMSQKRPNTNGLSLFLQGFDIDTTVWTLVATSEVLVSSSIRGMAPPRTLAVWATVLKTVPFAQEMFQNSRWHEKNYSNDDLAIIGTQAKFIRLWTAATVSTATVRLGTSSAHGTLLQALLQDFEEALPASTNYTESIVTMVQSLPLSSSHLLPLFLKTRIPTMANSTQLMRLPSDLSLLSSDSMMALQDDFVYKSHKLYFNDILSSVCQKINVNLRQFTSYARGLILRDKLSLKIVMRILRHNHPFKNALSMVGRQSTPTSNPSFPAECLRTMHEIAFAFAYSPATSPRQAYRKVRWCYLFMHRHGAPITPEITRALYHAGVIRYRTRGVAPEQLKWILGQIQNVEGLRVARRLAAIGECRPLPSSTGGSGASCQNARLSPPGGPAPAKGRIVVKKVLA